MTSIISFPGLGIDPFSLNRLAFQVGPLRIYWYGIIICTGIVLGFLIAYMRMKKIGISADDMADIALVCVPCSIIGARIYYVLAELETYDSFYEMIAIWNGGIAIYGAIIAGVIAFTIVSILLFVMFYPAISGFPVNGDYVREFLRWLPSWQLIG